MIKEYSKWPTTLGSVLVIGLYLITHSNGAHIPADLAMALKVAQSSNDLGIQLYLILSSTDRVNVVFSPVSLMMALGTTKLGPREGRKTLEEVSEVLQLKSGTVYSHVEQLKKLVINERNDGVNLEVKNLLLVKDESKKGAKSSNKLRFDYREEVIHSYNKNNSLLEDFVRDGGTMDLLNKVLFQAHWEIPFTVFKRFSFFTSGDEGLSNKVLAEFMGFMSDENQINYLDDGEHRCQVLELNYGKDIMPDNWDTRYSPADVSMVIILPYADQPLWRMEETLSSETIENWISRLKATNIDVTIPRFNISGFLDIGLPLKELGIRSIFVPSAGEEPIDEETGNIRSLWQETSIAATETGTEKPKESSEDLSIVLISNPGKTFQADRPFLFFIRDKLTNAILLMGRVVNPND